MSAENTGASPLIANRYTASGWETFIPSQPQSGYYSFKAVNSKYVAVQSSIQNTLIPTSTNNNDDVALFKIITPISPSSSIDVTTATQVKLYSKGGGAFIGVDSGSYFSSSSGVKEAAVTFKLVKTNNQYTLQNGESGKYASADNEGNNPVVVNRDAAAGWESFSFISQPGSTYSIQVFSFSFSYLPFFSPLVLLPPLLPFLLLRLIFYSAAPSFLVFHLIIFLGIEQRQIVSSTSQWSIYSNCC